MARPQYDKPLVFFFSSRVNFQTVAIPRGKKKKKKPIGNSIRAFFREKKTCTSRHMLRKKEEVTCRHIF